MTKSPYSSLKTEDWLEKTKELVANHPLTKEQIVKAVLKSWKQIFDSKIGPLSIGKQIFPTPQIMSSILHELIPCNLAESLGDDYKIGEAKKDKDIVYVPDNKYSIEVKASSSRNDIYANRSYAQPAVDSNEKDKNGYYIGVNFEKFATKDGETLKVKYDNEGNLLYPKITQIKFGYLDHTDWIPQASEKGQQARLTPEAKISKMLKIY